MEMVYLKTQESSLTETRRKKKLKKLGSILIPHFPLQSKKILVVGQKEAYNVEKCRQFVVFCRYIPAERVSR